MIVAIRDLCGDLIGVQTTQLLPDGSGRPALILLKAADRFAQSTTAVNQLWQTDFTYLRVVGWGWFYLSTVLDDFSRCILAWKLCTTMTAADVTETLRLALNAAELHQATVRQRPRLLSDNGPSYLSAQLGAWLDQHGMRHTCGQRIIR
jgi:transposase InsO family protein